MLFCRPLLRHRPIGIRRFHPSPSVAGGRPWTQQEVDTLVQIYKERKCVSEACTILCRPRSSIHQKLHKILPPLGLARPRPKFPRREWTQQDVDTIVQLWKEEKSVIEISAAISRSTQAIYLKLKQVLPALGIAGPSSRSWTTEEKERLLKLKHEESRWDRLIPYFPERSVTAVHAKHYTNPSEDRLGHEGPGKGRGARFTREEDEMIRRMRRETNPPTPWKEVTRRLRTGRPESSVVNRFYSHLIDLNADPMPTSRKKWTTAQLNELKGYIRMGMPLSEVAAKLGRTFASVLTKMYLIRKDPMKSDQTKDYSRRQRWTMEQKEELRALPRPNTRRLAKIAKSMDRTVRAVTQMWHLVHAEGTSRSNKSKG